MANKNREKIKADAILGLMFIICILFLDISYLVIRDKKISEEENRSLAQKPEFSLESLLRQEYGDQVETYLSDQFPFRDSFRTYNVTIEQIGGNRLKNNVYLGKGERLFKKVEKPDEKMLEKNLQALRQFAALFPEKGSDETPSDENSENSVLPKKMIMLLVPDAGEIYPEKLPSFAQMENEQVYFDRIREFLTDSVQFVDGVSIMKKYEEEEIYYRTDHHWTTLGAFRMFQETAPLFGAEIITPEQYQTFCVTGGFNGSLSRSSGFLRNVREEIKVFLPVEPVDVIVNYVDEQKRRTSVYDVSRLDLRDPYEVFFGGNSTLIEIRTTAASEKTLLVVKDSFANCFIPFLLPYYREILVVDPRYYAGTMSGLLKDYEPEDILFLYSGATFLSDHHLAGFLTEQSEADFS